MMGENKNEILEMIQDGKEYDEMFNYVKNKLAEPSRLGHGNNAQKALSELTNDIKYIHKFVTDSLEEETKQEEKTEAIREYSLQVMDELDSELDSMELVASRNGYIPFNLRNTSNSDIENASRYLETPEMRKGVRGKKLEFDGME